MKNKFEDLNLSDLNINKICRFCLSDGGILLPIYGPKEDGHLLELPTQIKDLFSVEVEKEDGLPSLICHSCLFNLERTVDFKRQCEEADSILRKFIKNYNRKTDNIVTKDGSCQAEVWNDVPVEEYLVLEKDAKEKDPVTTNINHETTKDNDNVVSVNSIHVDDDIEQTNNTPKVSGISEGNSDPEVYSLLQMEEEMNNMEENTYSSEPFSLDLCSVRLQSEGGGLQGAGEEALYPRPPLVDDDQWSESGSELSEDGEQVSSSGLNCSSCNKALPSSAELQRHQLIHRQEPPYPCDYCDQEFEEKTLLKAHWRVHAKTKPHMCLTCGEAFMERAELVRHFLVHDVIKPYHCPGCGKAFAYRSDLRKHAIIHTGVRPFKCPVCGKTFTRSTNLNKHARVHSGRRPYPCDHCDKMFSSRGDLVRHAVIHTGEKPYACLICSLAFNRKDKLSRHERVHMTDRPFVCSECPTSFHRKEELTKHSRFHHYKPDPEYLN